MCSAVGNATLDIACMSHRLNNSLHFFQHVTYLFICQPASPAPTFLCFCQHRQILHNTKECLLLEYYYLFMMPWSLPVHCRHCFSVPVTVSLTVSVQTVTLV